MALHGIDASMQPWHGFEYIWNQIKIHKPIRRGNRIRISNPMLFTVRGLSKNERFKAYLEVAMSSALDEVFFQRYMASYSSGKFLERSNYISNGEITDSSLKALVQDWQFLRLIPQFMTEPMLQKRSVGKIKMNKDGSNIAEYLRAIQKQDPLSFKGIVEALKVVLPFAIDLQPIITLELERKVYLALSEAKILENLPSWLLSTGTLRILALLGLLRNPDPPPVIIIEEIENGLDPRTIHLLVDEIQDAVESGRTQIILTTHSPYLLDLLPLSSLILVERIDGEPIFNRPADQKEVQDWAKRFSPGQLYTSNRLSWRAKS
jgi:AAA15 family ATPase/GTPase